MGDGDGGGGAVAVLGDDQVGLTGAGVVGLPGFWPVHQDGAPNSIRLTAGSPCSSGPPPARIGSVLAQRLPSRWVSGLDPPLMSTRQQQTMTSAGNGRHRCHCRAQYPRTLSRRPLSCTNAPVLGSGAHMACRSSQPSKVFAVPFNAYTVPLISTPNEFGFFLPQATVAVETVNGHSPTFAWNESRVRT